MIWLTLYLAAGLMWCMIGFGQAFALIERMRERGGSAFWRMVAYNFFLWPICAAFSTFLRFSPKLTDKLLVVFRRQYIDDERTARALRPQMLAPDPLVGIVRAWWCKPAEGQTCLIPEAKGYAEAMRHHDSDGMVDFTGVDHCPKPAVEHKHPVVEGEEGWWCRDGDHEANQNG